MLDPRIARLAEVLVTHSTELTPNDRVMIHAFDIPDEAVSEVVRAAQGTGAQVVVKSEHASVMRQQFLEMTESNAELLADIDSYAMDKMTAYIGMRGNPNVFENADVSGERKSIWQRLHSEPVHMKRRVPNTKWVVLRWPNAGMAQQAKMSTAAFEDFYFDVCTMDYGKMAKAVGPLKDLMDRTDRVEIKSPGTDLTFSIKDIGSVPCVGKRNIPDGECFSCPVKDSMNGTIQYNTNSLYLGQEYSNIRYVVKNGKIVEAGAGAMTDKLNEILDTDEGGRYFGEWALGFNPYVLHPMLDTLFDEKIAGSFHLTPGNAYPPPGGNGNTSAIHWDTVLIQRPEYGGGEIWFDGKLVRKDGLFVLPELEGLNPENLV
jgi:aminopeptidase